MFVDKPYPVEVEHKYPVEVIKKVPYEVKVPVDKPYKVEVEKPYPGKNRLDNYQISFDFSGNLYKTFFTVHVKVPVPKPYVVEKKIPYTVSWLSINQFTQNSNPKNLFSQVEKPVPYEVKVPIDKPYPVYKVNS